MSTLSKDDQEALRLLVQYVARAFYEPKFTIVLDQLVRHPVLKDDDLAGRMGLQLKELNKVMAVLENDKLVRIYRQNELKEGAQRSVGRQYYYIDYQHFCNVVKWRVAEMYRRIDHTLRNELDNKGYICPQCAGTFNCDVCHAELVDNENAESVRGSKDRMQRFNRQMQFIREGLRKTEDMLLPAFDVAQWIKTHIIDVERAKAAAQSGGLKIAGEGGLLKHEDSIGIVLSVDKDEATQRLERDMEAAAKRQQNVLPAWHLKSTISGDLTALGIRENAIRAQEVANSDGSAAAADKLPSTSSNDAILRGLSNGNGDVNGDVKPHVPQVDDVDYFDHYYASLAASAAPSAQDTPRLPDLGNEFGEEEDVKPSVEYLESLNGYRKRSRSAEDIGEGSGPIKTPRTTNGTPEKNGASASIPVDVDMAVAEAVAEEAAANTGDDPAVHVNGTLIPLSQVTEEHQELMTPEEYTAYYEILSK
ncbi:hypothetical protein EUX98_g3301 [Antrodiella citrinella]|uniref:HTH TFE/IIEalpha-type domain-containing protein n=1 Tax=Antrodiella citrinella TaxID=2447956 RepID=A0A4S4N543_9APHY|nr:hypothetical protein EUX98_g3301 [Antrodiella citrinella]